MSTAADILRKLGLLDEKTALALTQVFRSTPYPDPFAATTDAASVKLQSALTQAITAVAAAHGQVPRDPRDPTDPAQASVFPIPFTIADVTGAGSFPVAHYNGTEVDFVASEDKIAALYAAFELRAMVRRFATLFSLTTQKDLFKELKTRVDPIIRAQVPIIRDGKDVNGRPVAITNEQRSPKYEKVFRATPAGGSLQVDFTQGDRVLDSGNNFNAALTDMIVNSGDGAASICIRGIGYGFLNGALEGGGFFKRTVAADPKTGNGIWLAGDYSNYPFIRGVLSVNDGPAKIAGTTSTLARLMALIKMGTFADAADPGGDLMRTLLHGAGSGAFPPVLSTFLTKGVYVMNKLGWADLGRGEKGAHYVASEVALIQDIVKNGKSYVIAWQNLEMHEDATRIKDKNGNVLYNQVDIAAVVEKTVTAYEA
jgi:hypothetical protein